MTSAPASAAALPAGAPPYLASPWATMAIAQTGVASRAERTPSTPGGGPVSSQAAPRRTTPGSTMDQQLIPPPQQKTLLGQ